MTKNNTSVKICIQVTYFWNGPHILNRTFNVCDSIFKNFPRNGIPTFEPRFSKFNSLMIGANALWTVEESLKVMWGLSVTTCPPLRKITKTVGENVQNVRRINIRQVAEEIGCLHTSCKEIFKNIFVMRRILPKFIRYYWIWILTYFAYDSNLLKRVATYDEKKSHDREKFIKFGQMPF